MAALHTLLCLYLCASNTTLPFWQGAAHPDRNAAVPILIPEAGCGQCPRKEATGMIYSTHKCTYLNLIGRIFPP